MTATSPTAEGRRDGGSLLQMLQAGASSKEMERHLDALGPSEKLAEVRAVTGKGVGRLYEAMADAAPLSIEEFFPMSALGKTLIYQGRNSLPMFSSFQKRFYRHESGVIVGYNHQSMSFVTGPGFFVVAEASGEAPHPTEPYFDYTATPTVFPEGWPAYKPNDRGLSKPVYANMKDYMRRVARGVMVGRAYKLGVDQGQFFSLTLLE